MPTKVEKEVPCHRSVSNGRLALKGATDFILSGSFAEDIILICFLNSTLLIRNYSFAVVPTISDLFAVQPTCSDDLLLHFTYEEHFNDVTCHHAIATMYGPGTATLVTDGAHTAVRFDGSSYFEVGAIMNVVGMTDEPISVRFACKNARLRRHPVIYIHIRKRKNEHS